MAPSTAAAALGGSPRAGTAMDAGLSVSGDGEPAVARVEPAAAAATPPAEPIFDRPRKKCASKRIGVTKPKVKRRSVTDTMQTDADKLMSAVERGLIKFEDIAVWPRMPIGGVGVAPGEKGESAFRAYIKQPAVVERLVSQGFSESGEGAPHPWYLIKGPGVVSPEDKVICKSLTPEQREKIEASRVAALNRASQLRVRQEVAALHHEISDESVIASTTDAAPSALGAHFPDNRPCSLCGFGDDAGTIICCDACNTPFHDSCAGAPPISGDWLCATCK